MHVRLGLPKHLQKGAFKGIFTGWVPYQPFCHLWNQTQQYKSTEEVNNITELHSLM